MVKDVSAMFVEMITLRPGLPLYGSGAGSKILCCWCGDLAACLFDFVFTGEEKQDITFGFRGVDLQHGTNGGVQVVLLVLWGVVDFNRVGSTWHSEQWRVVEVRLELLSVQRGRHNDDLQVCSSAGDLLQQTHKNVGGQGSLVCFIENNHRVLLQVVVLHGFTEQHTIGHVLQHGLVGGSVLETDVVTNLLPQLHIHLIGNSGGNRHSSDSSWLSTSHLGALQVWQIVVQHELRNLGGLTGTCLTDENHNLCRMEDF
ncbi:hypothetical protein WICPIJ_003756 [Wickerhamomyces pijperi]|uniref:Uncharacterized protein n=1 Tax=Wickerhamomyces pijperi TaxID=599730 RepID=A0A9P8Q7A1_WICPI|nr:hypothetical protein WICPIJ_003756 [Wickerhamomyces pijperi]